MACLTARVRYPHARASSFVLALSIIVANSQPLPGAWPHSQDERPKNAQTPSPEQNPSTGAAGPIDFESHGMHYEALTKNGITVMFAPLPPHVKDYNIVQVTVTN